MEKAADLDNFNCAVKLKFLDFIPRLEVICVDQFRSFEIAQISARVPVGPVNNVFWLIETIVQYAFAKPRLHLRPHGLRKLVNRQVRQPSRINACNKCAHVNLENMLSHTTTDEVANTVLARVTRSKLPQS